MTAACSSAQALIEATYLSWVSTILFMLVRTTVLAARVAVTQAVALSAATTVVVAVASRIRNSLARSSRRNRVLFRA